MANELKQITELTLATGADGNDLLVIVSDPSGTAVTKRVTRTNFLGGTNVIQVVGTTETQTISGKTLTNPTINLTSASINIGTGTAKISAASTTTRMALDGGSASIEINNATEIFISNATPTISMFNASNRTLLIVNGGGAQANLNVQNNIVLAGTITGVTTESFTGSSSGTTVLQAAAVASGTITLPAATDTLMGKATTDTMTNKTFAFGSNTPTNLYKARGYLSGNQLNLTDTTWTKVVLNAESYDSNSNFDTTTGLYTVPVTGYYHISAGLGFAQLVVSKTYGMTVSKNGLTGGSGTAVFTVFQNDSTASTDALTLTGSDIVLLTAADTIQLDVIAYAGASTVDVAGGQQYTWLSICYLFAS